MRKRSADGLSRNRETSGCGIGRGPNRTEALAPAARLNGLDGLDCTTLGRPLSETWTLRVNPFWPARDTLTGALVPPCGRESEVVERAIEKS